MLIVISALASAEPSLTLTLSFKEVFMATSNSVLSFTVSFPVLSSKAKVDSPLPPSIVYVGGIDTYKFTLDGKTFSLKAENLNGSLLDKSISSKEKVLFLTNSIEIISSSMEITQTQPEGVKILFMNANLGNINSKSNLRQGKANEIEFLPEKNLIFMKGNTELYQENMKIISDEIYYDLDEDRILKSVNSKIINN